MSPNQTPPPEPEHTAASILGELVRVSRRHPALDPDDECSECGARLSAATDGTIYLADCGRYCSPECAESHATFLAGAWNRGNV